MAENEHVLHEEEFNNNLYSTSSHIAPEFAMNHHDSKHVHGNNDENNQMEESSIEIENALESEHFIHGDKNSSRKASATRVDINNGNSSPVREKQETIYDDDVRRVSIASTGNASLKDLHDVNDVDENNHTPKSDLTYRNSISENASIYAPHEAGIENTEEEHHSDVDEFTALEAQCEAEANKENIFHHHAQVDDNSVERAQNDYQNQEELHHAIHNKEANAREDQQDSSDAQKDDGEVDNGVTEEIVAEEMVGNEKHSISENLVGEVPDEEEGIGDQLKFVHENFEKTVNQETALIPEPADDINEDLKRSIHENNVEADIEDGSLSTTLKDNLKHGAEKRASISADSEIDILFTSAGSKRGSVQSNHNEIHISSPCNGSKRGSIQSNHGDIDTSSPNTGSKRGSVQSNHGDMLTYQNEQHTDEICAKIVDKITSENEITDEAGDDTENVNETGAAENIMEQENTTELDNEGQQVHNIKCESFSKVKETVNKCITSKEAKQEVENDSDDVQPKNGNNNEEEKEDLICDEATVENQNKTNEPDDVDAIPQTTNEINAEGEINIDTNDEKEERIEENGDENIVVKEMANEMVVTTTKSECPVEEGFEQKIYSSDSHSIQPENIENKHVESSSNDKLIQPEVESVVVHKIKQNGVVVQASAEEELMLEQFSSESPPRRISNDIAALSSKSSNKPKATKEHINDKIIPKASSSHQDANDKQQILNRQKNQPPQIQSPRGQNSAPSRGRSRGQTSIPSSASTRPLNAPKSTESLSRRTQSQSPTRASLDEAMKAAKNVDMRAIFRKPDVSEERRKKREEYMQRKKVTSEEKQTVDKEQKRKEAEAAFQAWLERKSQERKRAKSTGRALVTEVNKEVSEEEKQKHRAEAQAAFQAWLERKKEEQKERKRQGASVNQNGTPTTVQQVKKSMSFRT